MIFTVNWLTTIFPNYVGTIEEGSVIKHVTIDSRENMNDALFIPIKGERFDGHDYLRQAIDQGATATLWHDDNEVPYFVPEDFPVFFVSDTTKGLQFLASRYRQEIDPKVIGITGSNGKTTTKDVLASILTTSFKTHATAGNFNNDIGLPLTILSMPRETEILIVEMGMNDFDEINLLTKIAEPDFAVITNIGESHIEHLGSRVGIAKAKLEIRNGLKESGTLIIDGDEQLLNAIHNDDNVIKCGFGNHNDIVITHSKLTESGTSFTINNTDTYFIPLLGKHHAKNASFTIAISQLLHVEKKNIQLGLNSLKHSSMRFEFIESEHGAVMINDAYNASPTSMIAAIDVVKQLDKFSEKIVVLGDILELGEYANDLHLSVAHNVTEPIAKVFTLGEHAAVISEYINSNEPAIKSMHFSAKEQLVKELKEHLQENVVVLFKASRGMAFEEVVEKLKKE